MKSLTRVIEVAIHESNLKNSIRQLQGSRKTRYLAAGLDQLKKALEIAKGTQVRVSTPPA